MTVECAAADCRGVVVLRVLLGIYVNVNFVLFTLLVGINLLQSAFTNWCPMMTILRRAGLKSA